MAELDDFTHKTFEKAHLVLKKHKRKINVFSMRGMAWAMWRQYRDATIMRWAERIDARVSTQKLERLAGRVHQMLRNAGESWQPPCGDDGSFYAAYGLAMLRWINREAAGRVAVLRFTCAQLDAWILSKEPRQLRLL